MSATLLEVQRRMAAATMEPLTRNEVMRKKRRDGTAMEGEAAAFIKPNDRLTSFERLEIYNRQYWFRLYSSFEDDFPGLQAVLGRRQFERVMRAYLVECPSTSYTLRDLGARLHEWLRRNEELTGARSRLAQDVVELEWAHIEAYDAASRPTPTPELLAQVNEETCFSLQPHVRLLQVAFPVDDLLIEVRKDSRSGETSSNNATAIRRAKAVRRVADLEPTELWLAVHRQEFTVYYKRLRPEEFRMLKAMEARKPLGEVFNVFEDSSMADEERPGYLQECFHQWAVLGWLCPVSEPVAGDGQ